MRDYFNMISGNNEMLSNLIGKAGTILILTGSGSLIVPSLFWNHYN